MSESPDAHNRGHTRRCECQDRSFYGYRKNFLLPLLKRDPNGTIHTHVYTYITLWCARCIIIQRYCVYNVYCIVYKCRNTFFFFFFSLKIVPCHRIIVCLPTHVAYYKMLLEKNLSPQWRSPRVCLYTHICIILVFYTTYIHYKRVSVCIDKAFPVAVALYNIYNHVLRVLLYINRCTKFSRAAGCF